jgi:hypothetical protein
MANDDLRKSEPPAAPRFSYSTLLRALLPALVATGIVVFFFARSPAAAKRKPRPDGKTSVTLSQKDSAFEIVPPSKGGASAEVVYEPKGSTFHFLLHASALPPNHQYVLEIQADSTTYSVTSRAPDAHGGLVIDTTLARFAEGVCVGTNFDPPRTIVGSHEIKFRLKRDGSPASGTMPGVAASAPGAQLACHGNGDGNYDYVLLENDVADFEGMAPGRDSTR